MKKSQCKVLVVHCFALKQSLLGEFLPVVGRVTDPELLIYSVHYIKVQFLLQLKFAKLDNNQRNVGFLQLKWRESSPATTSLVSSRDK